MPFSQPGPPRSHLLIGAAGSLNLAASPGISFLTRVLPSPDVLMVPSASCPRPSLSSVSGSASCCLARYPPASPLRPGRGALAGAVAFFGPARRRAPEPPGARPARHRAGTRPRTARLFQTQGQFPRPLPKEEGNVDTPPPRRQLGTWRPQLGGGEGQDRRSARRPPPLLRELMGSRRQFQGPPASPPPNLCPRGFKACEMRGQAEGFWYVLPTPRVRGQPTGLSPLPAPHGPQALLGTHLALGAPV